MNQFLQQHQQKLIQFAKDNHLTYLALFGSHARGEETPESDVDLLVEFNNNNAMSLFDIVSLEHKAQDLLKKKVDLIPKDSLDKYVAPYIQNDLTVIYHEAT